MTTPRAVSMSSFAQREPLVSRNIGEMPKTAAVGFRLGPILRGYLPMKARRFVRRQKRCFGSGKCWAASPRQAGGHGSLCFQTADDASPQRNGSDNQHGAEYAPVGLLPEMQA